MKKYSERSAPLNDSHPPHLPHPAACAVGDFENMKTPRSFREASNQYAEMVEPQPSYADLCLADFASRREQGISESVYKKHQPQEHDENLLGLL